MANNVTGAELNPILLRMNNVPEYHPFDTDAFSDWSMEAGDMVTLVRDGEEYKSPVNVSRMVWKGNAPTVQISSTGNKERDPVAKISRKKYGRGSAGIRSQEGIHREFTSPDGILHSELHITEASMRTEFTDMGNSLRGEFEITASHLRTEFDDKTNSLRGEFEVTASGLRTEFNDMGNSLRGEFQVTASGLRTEFNDMGNSLRGEFQVTASGLRTEFNDMGNSLRGEFQVTASGLRTEFNDMGNSLRGEFQVTASGLRTEFNDMGNSLRGEFQVTASGLRTEFNDMGNSIRGEFQVTASGLRTEFNDMGNSLRGEFQVTASGLRTEFNDMGNSLRGEFQVTASGLRTEFNDMGNSLRGEFQVTASGLRTEFNDMGNSLRGEFQVTASGLRTEFNDMGNSLRGEFQVTASGLRTEFNDMGNSLRGEFQVTASGLRTEFDDKANSIRTDFEVTASGLNTRVSKVVDDDGTIKTAQICIAINEDNSSEAVIEADKIHLIGQTIANTITANYISTKIADLSVLNVAALSATGNIHTSNGYIAAPYYYIGSGNSLRNMSSGIWALQVVRDGNNYKIQKQDWDDADWVDVPGSFSRAVASWTMGWSNGTFTAKANPQNQSISTQIVQGTATYSGTTVTVPVEAIDSDNPSYQYATGRNVYLDFTSKLQNKTGTNKITSNGTYTPDTGYVGFSQVEIDVSGGSSGSTTISTSWNGSGTLTITASPQSVTEKRVLQAGTATWSGNIATIPISSVYGSSGQYTEGVVFSPTLDISSKITSAENAASANVTVNSAFSWANGQSSSIEAENNIATISTSGRKNASGTPEESTATKTFYMSIGAWGTPSAKKCYAYTLSGGQAAANRIMRKEVDASTVYGDGWAAARASTGDFPTASVAEADRAQYITVKRPNGTVDGTATSYTYYVTSDKNKAYIRYNVPNGNIIAQVTHNRYNEGWAAAYGKVSLPANNTENAFMVVKTPPSTVDGNAVETTYTLDTSNNNIAYIKVGSSVKAKSTHNKYNAGWAAAYGNVSLPANNTENAFMVVKTPPSTVDGNAVETTYTLDTSNNNIAYIKVGSSIKAQATHNKYNAGWTAAYNKVSLPANNTENAFMVVKTPPSTVGGDAVETTYTLDTSNNNIAYIKVGSSIKAQATHNKYTAGYNAAKLSLNTTSKKISKTTSGSVTEYTLALSVGNMVTTAGTDYGKRTFAIKATPNSGDAVEVSSTTLSDYRDGWTAAYGKVSLPANNTTNAFMVVKTPPSTVGGDAVETTYTLDTSNNNIAYIKVGSSVKAQATHNKYNAGWAAYNTALKWPEVPATADLTNVFSVKRPNETAGSASDAQIRNYTLANKDNNTVYLRRSSQTYAEFTHGKYDAGYAAAKLSLNTSTKKITKTTSGSITEYTLALVSDARITTSGSDYGKRKVWIKATPNSGDAVEVSSTTLSDYRDGWSAAYGKVSLPANSTSNAFMVVKTPPSTVGGNAVETTYTLDTSDNNIAYIKVGSSIKAQATHNKYNSGKVAGMQDVTVSSTFSWRDGPSSTVAVENNIATISTSGRKNASGNADESTATKSFYMAVGDWDTPSKNKCYAYTMCGGTTGGYRIMRKEVDASSIMPNNCVYLSNTSTSATVNVRIRRNLGNDSYRNIADTTIDLTNYLKSGILGLITTTAQGTNHQGTLSFGQYIYIGAHGVYDATKTWKVPDNPYPSTITMRQANGYAGARKMTMYFKDNNGNYHTAEGASTNMYWYFSSKDLNNISSYKTLHY